MGLIFRPQKFALVDLIFFIGYFAEGHFLQTSLLITNLFVSCLFSVLVFRVVLKFRQLLGRWLPVGVLARRRRSQLRLSHSIQLPQWLAILFFRLNLRNCRSLRHLLKIDRRFRNGFLFDNQRISFNIIIERSKNPIECSAVNILEYGCFLQFENRLLNPMIVLTDIRIRLNILPSFLSQKHSLTLLLNLICILVLRTTYSRRNTEFVLRILIMRLLLSNKIFLSGTGALIWMRRQLNTSPGRIFATHHHLLQILPDFLYTVLLILILPLLRRVVVTLHSLQYLLAVLQNRQFPNLPLNLLQLTTYLLENCKFHKSVLETCTPLKKLLRKSSSLRRSLTLELEQSLVFTKFTLLNLDSAYNTVRVKPSKLQITRKTLIISNTLNPSLFIYFNSQRNSILKSNESSTRRLRTLYNLIELPLNNLPHVQLRSFVSCHNIRSQNIANYPPLQLLLTLGILTGHQFQLNFSTLNLENSLIIRDVCDTLCNSIDEIKEATLPIRSNQTANLIRSTIPNLPIENIAIRINCQTESRRYIVFPVTQHPQKFVIQKYTYPIGRTVSNGALKFCVTKIQTTEVVQT